MGIWEIYEEKGPDLGKGEGNGEVGEEGTDLG